MSSVFRVFTVLCCVALLSSVVSAQKGMPSQPTHPMYPSVAQPYPQPDDPVCELLFDQYVARSGKIPSDSVAAAIHLVAVRGRNIGFWRTVLAEFDENCEPDGDPTVRRQTLAVLSKMLEHDGWSRWNREQDERATNPWPRATASYSALGPQVLDRIIARSAQANRHEINDFVLTVRASHDPRSKEFFRGIFLRGENIRRSPFAQPNVVTPVENVVHDKTLFYAAVALAELGDPAGVEWLIARTDVTQLGATAPESYTRALADLSGLRQPTVTHAQWQEWWSANKSNYFPAGRVNFR